MENRKLGWILAVRMTTEGTAGDIDRGEAPGLDMRVLQVKEMGSAIKGLTSSN